LQLALTHASLVAEIGGGDNQRLEFLGDAVLQLVVSEWLYAQRRDWDEGELSRARAALVSARNFAALADRWELGPSLRVAKGDRLTGTAAKVNVRADAFEAVAGAIFLDAGLDAVRAAVVPLLGPPPQEARAAVSPRSVLLEWAQAQKLDVPTYDVVGESGPAHQRRFSTVVTVAGRRFGPAEGDSKKTSALAAAQLALAELVPSR
jgi:ribonuclease-3